MADPTIAQRKQLAKMRLAMPDGSYYIRNGSIGASDLQNAIDAVGRGEPQSSHDAIRKHIMTRAKALGLSDKIPDNWNSDGSLKHDAFIAEVEEFLKHFGVKGMHWGVRRPRGSGSTHPVSEDAARAHATQETIRKHGVSAVNSADLQHLVSRRNLERQHSQLSGSNSTGRKAAEQWLVQFGKQQASALANEAIKAGSEALVKKLGK